MRSSFGVPRRYRSSHRPAAVAFRRAVVVAGLPVFVAAAQGGGSAALARTEAPAASASTTTGSIVSPAIRAVASSGPDAGALPAGVAATGAVTIVPFGRAGTALTCMVLRACVVELEPGEVLVNEPLAGDQARWIIAQARAGPAGANALVVVKPKACNVTTNLVLSTDRRIYDFDLDSPPCSGSAGSTTNPKRAYVRHIRFSYPDDSARTARLGTRTSVADSGGREREPVVHPLPLNREYTVVRTRRWGPFGLFGEQPIDFPWIPTAIGDDGAHVYVTLPSEARQHAAPVLYAVESDGSRTLVNYTMRDTVIVSDRTFRRGLFVIAAGEREQRLEFENLAWNDVPEGARRDQ